MGSIAHAIGAELFEPYVMDLMKASEEALEIDDARLKETSFLLWGELCQDLRRALQAVPPPVSSRVSSTRSSSRRRSSRSTVSSRVLPIMTRSLSAARSSS